MDRLKGSTFALVTSPKLGLRHLAIKMSPFELALGIETKQPMDLTILRTKDTCCEGVKDVKKMAKDHEESHKPLSF
jgi:hypothetical protein